MNISISTNDIQLGYERTPSSLNIDTRTARLEFRQKQAEMNIHTELPRVLIDQYECFASAGLKNAYDLTKEAAQKAYQNVLEFIGKTASDGRVLAAIEKGGNPLAEMARRDSVTVHVFGLDFIPKVGPTIEVVGDVELDAEKNSAGINNGVDGSYTPGDININYRPAVISIYVRQYPSIEIQYTGNTINASV